MCEPVSIAIAVASAAAQLKAQHDTGKQQQTVADQADINARVAYIDAIDQENVAAIREDQALSDQLFQLGLKEAQGTASLKVAGLSAGLDSSQSMEGLLDSYLGQNSMGASNLLFNRETQANQSEARKKGHAARGQSRINQAASSVTSRPDWLGAGIKLGSNAAIGYGKSSNKGWAKGLNLSF